MPQAPQAQQRLRFGTAPRSIRCVSRSRRFAASSVSSSSASSASFSNSVTAGFSSCATARSSACSSRSRVLSSSGGIGASSTAASSARQPTIVFASRSKRSGYARHGVAREVPTASKICARSMPSG